MATSPDAPSYPASIDPERQVMYVACSGTCHAQWLLALAPRVTWHKRQVIPADGRTCSHCCWCGELLIVPMNPCIIHDNGCPDVDFGATEVGPQVARWIILMEKWEVAPEHILRDAARMWREGLIADPKDLAAQAIENHYRKHHQA